MCSLCLTEKVLIATANNETSLNERSEVTRRCRHRDKMMLTNFLSNHPFVEEDQGRQEELFGLEEEDDSELEEEEEEPEQEGSRSMNDGEEDATSIFRRLRRNRATSYKHFY